MHTCPADQPAMVTLRSLERARARLTWAAKAAGLISRQHLQTAEAVS